MTAIHSAEPEWVRRALTEATADPEAAAVAEQLIAIAEQHSITIEALVTWIHLNRPGDLVTARAWQRTAKLLAKARETGGSQIASARR